MKVAAIYDIHANLPALEAVIQDIHEAEVDQIIVGGDVVPGPMPRETLRCLLDLDLPMQFIYGNGELAMLAQMAAKDEDSVMYWGTVSGNPLPEQFRPVYRWTVKQLYPDYESVLATWPKAQTLEIPNLGKVLFCHSTPRSETEVFTRLTPEEKLLPIFEALNVDVVICGHTHMQFDRMIGKTRVINAGSVGQPYGTSSAYWLLLGLDVELQRTLYDFAAAAERIQETDFPNAEEFANEILQPPSEAEMLELFTGAELR